MRLRPFLLVVALMFVGMASAGPTLANDKEKDYELFKLFVDSYEQIERNYVKEVDRRELIEAAIQGMLRKLDPYSNYIPPENLRAFSDTVDRQFGGLGIQVNLDEKTNRLTVTVPLPGTPAQKAGMLPGDVIAEIEGKPTDGFTIDDAVKVLRGKPGTPVTIKVARAGTPDLIEMTIVRDIIRVATVQGISRLPNGDRNFMLDEENKVGYARLSTFSRNSTKELHEALKTLTDAGVKGFVLDLRFNPGGLLSVATEISDLFIEDGKIVSTKGRNTEEQVYTAKKPGTYTDFPMVVLVNRYSASASEIVSACLQDHKRAVIIGERTWGKGSVQNVINLEDDQSALKLTTASYHRPSGKNIHRFPGAKPEDEWGVMPDETYKIRLGDEEIKNLHIDFGRRDSLIKDDEEKTSFVDRQQKKASEYLIAKITGKPLETPEKTPADKEKKESVAKKDEPAAKPEPKPE